MSVRTIRAVELSIINLRIIYIYQEKDICVGVFKTYYFTETMFLTMLGSGCSAYDKIGWNPLSYMKLRSGGGSCLAISSPKFMLTQK